MTADPSPRGGYRRAIPAMGTIVTIDVFSGGSRESAPEPTEREAAVERALEWFRRIEACCTRFDPASELMQLSQRVGSAVAVSAMLYEAVQFALAVAEASDGAFDPTVGLEMEARGFNREYCTGTAVQTESRRDAGSTASGVSSAAKTAAALMSGPRLRPPTGSVPATYKDVRLDPASKSITLLRPLGLDLGAVAKGLAIDTAARELRPFRSFAIDAGGDLYLGGTRPDGAPWSVGIRHPRANDDLIEALRVSDCAVCTSGDYERRRAGDDASGQPEHHILDPRTGISTAASVSATVIAPSAMLADALATAAFVLGPAEGVAFLERLGVEGLIVAPSLETRATKGLVRQSPAARAAESGSGGEGARL